MKTKPKKIPVTIWTKVTKEDIFSNEIRSGLLNEFDFIKWDNGTVYVIKVYS